MRLRKQPVSTEEDDDEDDVDDGGESEGNIQLPMQYLTDYLLSTGNI